MSCRLRKQADPRTKMNQGSMRSLECKRVNADEFPGNAVRPASGSSDGAQNSLTSRDHSNSFLRQKPAELPKEWCCVLTFQTPRTAFEERIERKQPTGPSGNSTAYKTICHHETTPMTKCIEYGHEDLAIVLGGWVRGAKPRTRYVRNQSSRRYGDFSWIFYHS